MNNQSQCNMVYFKCPFEGCEYQILDESSNVVGLHKVKHEQYSGSSSHAAVPNVPQLIRSS